MHRDRLRRLAAAVEGRADLDLTKWDRCPMAVACEIPEFKALGLKPDGWWTVKMPPNLIGYECAEELFGIDTKTAYWLFSPKEYAGQPVTGPMVAARLRELADTKE